MKNRHGVRFFTNGMGCITKAVVERIGQSEEESISHFQQYKYKPFSDVGEFCTSILCSVFYLHKINF